MTSPANDQQTRAFFAEQDHFGLDPANIMIFPQQMMPAMDKQTGKVLMAEPGKLAMSPNGHGGSLKALWTSGAVADMTHRGIEQISYVQVDNPLVKVIDPLFLGLHAMDDAEMSSKMLPKAYPKEKLGNLCVVDGKVTVIEYSDLPDELAEQRREDGSLRFQAGSIAIHMMTLDFVAKLNESSTGFALPYHRAEKKVPYVDLLSGQTHKPESPNAVKLETFVFDALPMCERSIVLETERVEEFAPIKNADAEGCVDCPRSSKRLQSERAARWLQANGVSVPRDDEGQLKAVLEISQKTAIDPEDLGQMELSKSIEPNTQMLL
jgi:UDP-N-acetylglucosamine/UDP-N-acetylgalactosamine diphosphorylase